MKEAVERWAEGAEEKRSVSAWRGAVAGCGASVLVWHCLLKQYAQAPEPRGNRRALDP